MLRTLLTKTRVALLFGLSIIGLAATIVPLASADNFSATWGYAKDVKFSYVDYSNDDYIYTGELRDTSTPNGYCVEMQRKTSSGSWVRTGFTNNSTGKTNTNISACTTSYVAWSLPSSYAESTTGLRMVDGSGRYLTMCSTSSACKDLNHS